jgi:hypothetical protein
MEQQQSHSLKSNLVYYIPTVLITVMWTFGAIGSLMKSPTSMEVFHRLGYPNYFATLLGTAQLLGVIAILAPVPRTLREWAYAGLTFDASAAIISIMAIGSPVFHLFFPAMGLALVLTSYRAWRVRVKENDGLTQWSNNSPP